MLFMLDMDGYQSRGTHGLMTDSLMTILSSIFFLSQIFFSVDFGRLGQGVRESGLDWMGDT